MNSELKKIDICLSPAYYNKDNYSDNIVVVIDIVRASTTICVAFDNGATEIIPVRSVDEALLYKLKGYLVSGERNGFKVEGFDMGNSPFEYSKDKVNGKKIAFTTTNGTQALTAANETKSTLIGSFINYDIIFNWLSNQNTDILLFCSGVENAIAIEDVLFAGKLAQGLINTGDFFYKGDVVPVATTLFESAKDNLFEFVMMNSVRLNKRRDFFEQDIRFCLSDNQVKVIPQMLDGRLLKKKD
jgi:2-phosphosulfolactate phosphatase